MVINVRLLESYGNARYYPDNEISKTLLKMFNRKSFTKTQLQTLKKIGFRINIMQESKHEKI